MMNMNNDAMKDLINLVIQKNIHENNISLMIQNQMNQGFFLQKKRFFENQNINYNNFGNPQKNINFYIQNNNEYQYNFETNLSLTSQMINPNFAYWNNNCYNLNGKGMINNSLNYLFPTTHDNKLEKIFIKSNINNVYNNLNGNHTNDFFNNYFNIENDKENINVNNDNCNSTDSSNSTNLSNNNAVKKTIYFNVSHIKNEKPKKRGGKKNICQTENNNEIKVLKNNKVVYVNTFLLNSYTTSKNIKKLNKIAFIGRNKRSSRYRGVSKNGNQWQVLMMINKNKSYIGSYPSEELAARIYDILALKNRGFKARTNFIYNSKQIKTICELDIDIKSKDIEDIISHLIL